ncbi:hypothetical protein CPB86DRAFT_818444 [Serendipita vermifera]|nr:hypothetical protein CPB86DRAFT_818444 [Serendipita vermifera]
MPSISLDDMPEEIILEIVEYLQGMLIKPHYYGPSPISIEILHLTLCCKRFQRIAVPIIYHSISFSRLRMVERFLETIIEYPTYAPLVKVCKYSPQSPGSEEPRGVDFSKAPEIHALAPELIQAIKEGKAWTHALPLPYLLPNLETLHVNLGSYRNEEKIFELHLSRLLAGGLVPTTLQSFTWIAFQTLNIISLISALSLPSVTRLCFTAQIGSSKGVVTQYGTSSVEELQLITGKLPEEELSMLLKVPRVLKRFTYYQVMNETREGFTMDGFLRALESVISSLEFLNVGWCLYEPYFSDSAFLSFDSFVSLNTLFINYRLVYGPDPNSAPCIADSLPKSLEVLAMRRVFEGKWTEDILPDIWKRLLLKKSSTCLSRLRMIGHLNKFELLFPLNELAATRNVKVACNREEVGLWT